MMKYWFIEWRLAAIRNGIREALAYRGEFIVEMIGSAVVPAGIQFMLWYSIFHHGGASSFAGMNYPELLAYTWTSLLFTQIRGGDYDFALIEMIRTGGLNNFLLRPVGVVEFTFYQGFGDKLLAAALCLSLGLVATFFTDLSAVNLLLGLTLALLGNIIHYLFGAALAAVAFYWENAFAILMVKNMMVALLCGELLPLSIVPEKYAFIWQSTPFYLYVYGPTQIALGKWDHSMWLHQMGIGILWLLAFWAALKIVWSYSIHRYQGIGG